MIDAPTGAGIPEGLLVRLEAVARRVEVPTGGEVVIQDPSGHVGVVAHGQLAVAVPGDGGRMHTIALLQEGDALVLPGDAWPEAAGAVMRGATDSVVLVVVQDMTELLAADPELGAWIVHALAGAVADRERSTAIALEPRVERRLLFKLRQLGEHWGRVTPEGVRLDLRVTHQELADMVGAARESVTVAFGRLQEQGEIEMRQRTVIIRRMNDQSLTATEIA